MLKIVEGTFSKTAQYLELTSPSQYLSINIKVPQIAKKIHSRLHSRKQLQSCTGLLKGDIYRGKKKEYYSFNRQWFWLEFHNSPSTFIYCLDLFLEGIYSLPDGAAKDVQSTLLSTMTCPSIGVKGAAAAGICTVALISACIVLTVYLTGNRDSSPGTKSSNPELIVSSVDDGRGFTQWL